jgi:hypothetical protein
VKTEKGPLTYELFEKYAEAFAKAKKDNDTSFMVTGNIEAPQQEVDGYPFKANDAQYVTLTLVPENALSDVDLELADGTGKVIATSKSDGAQTMFGLVPVNVGHYIDFIQLHVNAGDKFTAKVSAKTAPVTSGYRLIVVGSTTNIPTSDIKGKHQQSLK